jgi:hypothetical protein
LIGVLSSVRRRPVFGPSAPVIACETRGAASLALSLKRAWSADGRSSSGKAEVLALDGITTIASSLGSTKVSRECLDRTLAHEERGGVVSVVMEDERCVASIRTFAGALSLRLRFSARTSSLI